MTLVLEDRPRHAADTIHILIADDQPFTRAALRQALPTSCDATTIRETRDLASLSEALAAEVAVDLVLLDPSIPGVSGFSGLLYLRSQHPAIPIVVVSASEDRAVMRRCIDVGAAGFIPKGTDIADMRRAIRMVLDGEIWVPAGLDAVPADEAAVADMMRRVSSLTPQQLRVLMMLAQGLLNKQIAFELKVSEATVKAHVSAVLQKLGVESRTQAVVAVSTIDRGQFKRNVSAS